jgi:hypothetical protein
MLLPHIVDLMHQTDPDIRARIQFLPISKPEPNRANPLGIVDTPHASEICAFNVRATNRMLRESVARLDILKQVTGCGLEVYPISSFISRL